MFEFVVVGMNKSRKLLLVRSTKSKGQQIGINKNTFKYSKLSLMRMTGMTEEEYNEWEKQYELN